MNALNEINLLKARVELLERELRRSKKSSSAQTERMLRFLSALFERYRISIPYSTIQQTIPRSTNLGALNRQIYQQRQLLESATHIRLLEKMPAFTLINLKAIEKRQLAISSLPVGEQFSLKNLLIKQSILFRSTFIEEIKKNIIALRKAFGQNR